MTDPEFVMIDLPKGIHLMIAGAHLYFAISTIKIMSCSQHVAVSP